jgi:hypothetical protein
MHGTAYRWMPEALNNRRYSGILQNLKISKEERHLSLKEHKADISGDFRPAFSPHPGHLLRQFGAENQQIDICKGLRRFIVSARKFHVIQYTRVVRQTSQLRAAHVQFLSRVRRRGSRNNPEYKPNIFTPKPKFL